MTHLQSKENIETHLQKLYRVRIKTKTTLKIIEYWEQKLKTFKTK